MTPGKLQSRNNLLIKLAGSSWGAKRIQEFTATSLFCIFSQFSVKLRENGWLNFQPQKICINLDNSRQEPEAITASMEMEFFAV